MQFSFLSLAVLATLAVIVLCTLGVEQLLYMVFSILWLTGLIVAMHTNVWLCLAALFLPPLALMITIGSLITGRNFAEYILALIR